ncbi:MAG: hypothetical protein QW331_03565 [Candidatus Woesearchaeota archaeon]
MAFETIINIIVFFWTLFKSWIFLFFAPFYKAEMFWIIIPIYLNWVFTEFYQEKRETDFGNAIANGVVALWIGLDWTRLLIDYLEDGVIFLNITTIFKFVISFGITIYGLFIIIEGIKTRRFVMFAGRIREVTYLLLMFTPIIYGIVDLTWRFFFAIILFFPLFYWIIEWIDRIVPDPITYYQ